jgi:hypothetical protein
MPSHTRPACARTESPIMPRRSGTTCTPRERPQAAVKRRGSYPSSGARTSNVHGASATKSKIRPRFGEGDQIFSKPTEPRPVFPERTGAASGALGGGQIDPVLIDLARPGYRMILSTAGPGCGAMHAAPDAHVGIGWARRAAGRVRPAVAARGAEKIWV